MSSWNKKYILEEKFSCYCSAKILVFASVPVNKQPNKDMNKLKIDTSSAY